MKTSPLLSRKRLPQPSPQLYPLRWGLRWGLLFWVLTGYGTPGLAQTTDRWLEIRRLGGTVRMIPSQRPAQKGDRLEQIGQGLATGPESYSILLIDQNIGTVNIAENTDVTLKQLSTTPNQGRVTILSVTKGLARLKIRAFNNPNSRLEIETPAGITGVRGTEFSIGVNHQGQTVLATQEGQVAASAQGKTVLVQPGFATRIVPGEVPEDPRQVTNDLTLQRLSLFRTSLGTVAIKGRVEPFNLVKINGQSVTVDRDGNFQIDLPVPLSLQLKIQVQNLLDQKARYPLLIR
jgi:hypothetical protein